MQKKPSRLEPALSASASLSAHVLSMVIVSRIIATPLYLMQMAVQHRSQSRVIRKPYCESEAGKT